MKFLLIVTVLFISCACQRYPFCQNNYDRIDRNFDRGLQLACDTKWDEIIPGKLYWHTFKQYDNLTGGFPYFMFTYCSNLTMDHLIDIEVVKYPRFSKCWIDQLIYGETLPDGTQRLIYDFMMFKNRIVYQNYQWKQLLMDGYQFYIYTVEGNDPEYISMGEDVHKFIYPENTCNRVVYVGAEDPKGWLTPFPIKYLYLIFYRQHYNKQIKCLQIHNHINNDWSYHDRIEL